MMPKLSRRAMRLRWLLLAIPIVFVFVAIAFFHRPILVFMGHWLDVGERPRAADFVMVLPGGAERRPFVAAAMMRAGLAHGVLTPRTESLSEDPLVPAPDILMRRTLVLRGIHEDRIQVLPGHSNSTWTDAVALARFLQDHRQASVAIVTDNYHTRRSRWVFRKVLGSDARRVFFVSAPMDTVSPDTWWTTEEGLSIYVGEYFKFMIYFVTEGTAVILALGIGFPLVLAWWLMRRRTSVRANVIGRD